MRRFRSAAAAAADTVALLVFAAIGRRSHAESGGLLGALDTAWPFLAGTALGWALTLAARRAAPWTLRGGILVWVATVVGGMLLRALTGAGVAVSFIVVATLVTAVFLLGWRAVVAVASRRSHRPGSSPPAGTPSERLG